MQPGGSVWALNGVLDIIFLSARNVRMNSAGLRVYNMPWQHVSGIHCHRKGSVPSQAQDSSPLVPELHKKYSLSKTGWSRLQTFRNNPKWTCLHITLIPGASSSTQLLWMHSSRVITSTWRSNHLLSAACVFVSQAISSTLQKYSYCMLLHDCGKTFLNSKWRFRKNHPPGFFSASFS